jgi:methyl-accepting chemotaxis protein
MATQATFGRRLGAGIAVIIALGLASSVISLVALDRVVTSKDAVITSDAPKVMDSAAMRAAIERKGGANRGFLLTREERFLDQAREARAQFTELADRIRPTLRTDEGKAGLATVMRAEQEHDQAQQAVIELRRGDVSVEAVSKAFEDQVQPRRETLDVALRAFVDGQLARLEAARATATETADSATLLVLVIAAAMLLLGLVVAIVLARALGRQIGTAVGQVQSSSAELQAAANQQATGAKEQATAMSQIGTTIIELLASSRQIAESAQRVALIAGQTATSARAGDQTVGRAHESIDGIRKQVDQVVSHMLELGKKSQEIGVVLDLVSELAEQTNILAINATIEAVGAGDAGKRFAVVADEIRKLADRVGGSTKEIRSLIEDVRGAVNTTVMATETGSKTVDAGSRQFAEVTAAFRQIAGLVSTTTEAAREIELSTKQQTTAVEQVNVAIASMAQATKETEASSGQTLVTASQLASLSKDLMQLVQRSAPS